jgi:hypothetical protein
MLPAAAGCRLPGDRDSFLRPYLSKKVKKKEAPAKVT